MTLNATTKRDKHRTILTFFTPKVPSDIFICYNIMMYIAANYQSMNLRHPLRYIVIACLLWLFPSVLPVLQAQPLPYFKSEKIIIGQPWLKNVNTVQMPRVLKHPKVGVVHFNRTGNGYLLSYNNKGIAEYDSVVFTADGEIHAYALKNQFVKAEEDYFITSVGQSTVVDVLKNDASYSNIKLVDIPFEEGLSARIQGNRIRLETLQTGLFHFYYTACDNLGHCDESKVTVFVLDPSAHVNTIVLSEVTEQQLTLPLPAADYQLVRSDILHVYPDGTGQFMVDLFSRDMGENEILFENPEGKLLKYRINFIDKWGENRLNTSDKIYLHPGNKVEVDLTSNDFWLNVFNIIPTNSDIQVKRTGGGKVEIQPRPGFMGKTSFKYVTCAFPRCDTSTVEVFVDHFAPARDRFEFMIDPSQDYYIPFHTPNKDYQLSVISQPRQGVLNPVDQGRSLLFTPNTGFSGVDNARIRYSYKTPTGYYQTDHYIRLMASPYSFRGDCTDCVWPGDTDQNGMVDLNDAQAVARYMGEKGTGRYDGDVWKKQRSYPWNNYEGQDLHHADADGNGLIAASDLEVIQKHYGKTHGLYVNPLTWMDVPVVVVQSRDEITPGGDILFEFNVGDEDHKLFNVTGFSTEVKVAGSELSPTQIEIVRDENNWLKSHQPTLSLKAATPNGYGQVAAGEFRTRSYGVQGFGTALKLRIIVEDEVEGFRSMRAKSRNTLKFIFQNLKVHTRGGTIQLPDQEIEIPLKEPDLPEENNEDAPMVFPNPARDEVSLRWPQTGHPVTLDIQDLNGRKIRTHSWNSSAQSATISVDHLAPGMYILRWESDDKTWNQKLTILN